MKKILSIFLFLICIIGLISCNETPKIVGTYEATSITGSIVNQGIEEPLIHNYEYYNIILNSDGTIVIEYKSGTTGEEGKREGTWKWEDGIIRTETEYEGQIIIEEMTWENDTITYISNSSVSDITISRTMILKKETED